MRRWVRTCLWQSPADSRKLRVALGWHWAGWAQSVWWARGLVMRSSHVGRIGQRSKKFAQGLCLCEEVVRQLLHSLVMWRWFCSALKLSDTVQPQQERQFRCDQTRRRLRYNRLLFPNETGENARYSVRNEVKSWPVVHQYATTPAPLIRTSRGARRDQRIYPNIHNAILRPNQYIRTFSSWQQCPRDGARVQHLP